MDRQYAEKATDTFLSCCGGVEAKLAQRYCPYPDKDLLLETLQTICHTIQQLYLAIFAAMALKRSL